MLVNRHDGHQHNKFCIQTIFVSLYFNFTDIQPLLLPNQYAVSSKRALKSNYSRRHTIIELFHYSRLFAISCEENGFEKGCN